jgi:acyl-CoA thioesterase-2
MADLADDTAVVGADGRYTANVSSDWEIWGPCGGYVASIALRAAGAASAHRRPTSFMCHYLGVATFDTVDLTVDTIRQGRSTESLRVSMTQGGKPILEAMVLSTARQDALTHDTTVAPDVPDPDDLLTVAEHMAGRDDVDDGPPFRFWENVDSRAITWRDEWPPDAPLEPVWTQWQRFVPEAVYDDLWVDACRSVMWIDIGGWPSTHNHHAWQEPPWVAVNVDLYVAFHHLQPESRYLLVDANAPIAADGLVGYTSRVWSESRALVASGGGQLYCRSIAGVPQPARPSEAAAS